MRRWLSLALLCLSSLAAAHDSNLLLSAQAKAWLDSLDAQKASAAFPYDHSARTAFKWVPGLRAGIRLDAMSDAQRHELRDILREILSEKGAIKVDAIIATEAALAVIERSPGHRNPGKYYTAIFGEPGADKWMLRFEGHHLSVNLSFRQNTLVSATPLFLGVNPETILSGPDKGLRAMAAEVDLARALFLSLSEEQRALAGDSKEWFAGFLTDAGSRRAEMGEPAGILVSELSLAQQDQFKLLVGAYVETIGVDFSAQYLSDIWASEWQALRFFWRGSAEKGENYYYRIAGKRLLIEHETQSGDDHIHAVWRDASQDFDL